MPNILYSIWKCTCKGFPLPPSPPPRPPAPPWAAPAWGGAGWGRIPYGYISILEYNIGYIYIYICIYIYIYITICWLLGFRPFCRSFVFVLFWVFLCRFLHGRRSVLGFGPSCLSVQASVWVAACFPASVSAWPSVSLWLWPVLLFGSGSLLGCSFSRRLFHQIRVECTAVESTSSSNYKNSSKLWARGGVGYRPSLATCRCRHGLQNKK